MFYSQDKQVFVGFQTSQMPKCRCDGKVSRGRTSSRRERTTLNVVNAVAIPGLLDVFTVGLGKCVGWVSSMQRAGTKLAGQLG